MGTKVLQPFRKKGLGHRGGEIGTCECLARRAVHSVICSPLATKRASALWWALFDSVPCTGLPREGGLYNQERCEIRVRLLQLPISRGFSRVLVECFRIFSCMLCCNHVSWGSPPPLSFCVLGPRSLCYFSKMLN